MVAGSRIKLKDNASLFVDDIHTWPKEAYYINEGCIWNGERIYKQSKLIKQAYEEVSKPELDTIICYIIDGKPWAYIASNDYFTEIKGEIY